MRTDIITSEIAHKYRVVYAGVHNNVLQLTVSEDEFVNDLQKKKEELQFITGYPIEFLPQKATHIFDALNEHYTGHADNDDRLQYRYYEGKADNFLDDLISEAQTLNSSDIHIEVYDKECRVRIRVDGLLILRYKIEKTLYPSLINKIKIASNLDIAEKRLPQDGRIFYQKMELKLDIRVSIVPTLYGEKVVLRLLSNDATHIRLESLGFSENDLKNYKEGLKRPFGILLISGPTGSGKTTTLYATLKVLNQSTRNIITIEDPIEYTLDGVNQVQVKENIGLSFAIALRTFLRQDPDVIMLGEIRDAETAHMAVRAALTGHLVLSTIHTNSAWGTISRLIDMGVPPFLIANTLNTTVAQRLVRILCPNCKRKEPLSESVFPAGYRLPEKLYYHYIPSGCSHCYNTGYKGRKAIYEVIYIDELFAEAVKKESQGINDMMKLRNINSLSGNAFELVKIGETSIEEVYPILLS